MNFLFKLTLVAAVGGASVIATVGATPLPSNFLKANGCDLCDHGGTGQVVSLRGVSLGGWFEMENWMCPAFYGSTNPAYAGQGDPVVNLLISRFGPATTDALLDTYESNWITGVDLDLVAQAGMNLVRCPIHWSMFYEYQTNASVALTNVAWKADVVIFKHIDWLVNACSNRNLYVVFDEHNPEGENLKDTNGNCLLYAFNGYTDRLVETWRRMAVHYAGNPTVLGYDLVNESPGSPNLNAVWNTCYQTIRSNDPDHCIIAETYSIPACTNLMHTYGWQNVVASGHDYWSEGTDYSGPLQAERALAPGKLVCPYYVGEFMENANSNGVPRILNYQTAGNQWTAWTLKTVNQQSWSLENAVNNGPSISTDLPDLVNDSAAVISNKWTLWRTQNNPAVYYRGTMNRLAAPMAVNDVLQFGTNGTVTFSAQTLLANDTDLNQYCNLSVTNLPVQTAHGTLTTTTNGFRYQADAGYIGLDSFTYRSIDQSVNLRSPNAATVTLVSILLPLPPTGLKALGGSQHVDLNWSSVAGATAYNVKLATASGGPYATIGSNVTATSFVHLAAPTGMVSYYVVSAVNAQGEGPNSTEVYGAPVNQTLAPVADAYVRGGSYANNNFGTSLTLDLKEDPNASFNREAYVQFKVDGLTNSPLTLLWLMPLAVGTPVPGLTIETLANDSWTESGINWNNQPIENGTVVASVTNYAVGTPIVVDLTAAVHGAAAADGLLSLRLMLTTPSVNVSLGSRWQPIGMNQPQLLVTLPPAFTLACQRTANAIQITWPLVYLNPHLLAQTDPAGGGLGTNWSDMGMVSSPVTLPLNGTNGSVFYRLKIP